ncbi:MAG TPA: TetR/AcrR family transcriptional regulator [Candidatus Binataceae bacterium]|nr:TetR/AcrR family transcriptional regulator [Candidatus Binataceae bacterium]
MVPKARKQAARTPAPPTRRRGTLDLVLIDAAMDLFASYGYRGTSLARIARAAGVTKGALYWHFSDKEDFFLAVLDRVMSEWGEVFAAPAPASDLPGYREQFLRVFDLCSEVNEKNPWVSRLTLIIALESHKIGPRVLRTIRRINRQQLASWRELVERGKKIGALDANLDLDWAATQCFSGLVGLELLWYLHGPRFDIKRSFRRQAREFLRLWSAEK